MVGRGTWRVVALALAAIGSGATSAVASAPPPRPISPPPANVLLVLVDDQAMNTFTPHLMPKTYRWIVRPGTKFTAGLAAPPLCCPDRAGILTGDYPHDSGVFSNSPGYASLTDNGDTLPVWLRAAGYRTGLVGHFLNGYESAAGAKPAPGFGSWFGYDHPTRYFDYIASDQGTFRFFGNARRDYTTSVFTREALRFLRVRSRKPFFLWLAYNAPHDSHVPRPHCDGYDPIPPEGKAYLRYENLHLPRPPSFNEADMSDKPAAIASLPLLDRRHVGYLIRRYRCTAAAMHGVDAGVGRVMHVLRHRGELRRTIVLYLSDNGYFFGEHRIDFGKAYPYEPALRVPYAVRIPAAYRSGPAPNVSREVVTNQDIAPTILDYAGGVAPCAAPGHCRTIDGRSLRPLLAQTGGWPADRGVLAELSYDFEGTPIHYSAIRTARYTYVEYADGERELYDLERDPNELRNLDGQPADAATEAALAQRLAALRVCSGHSGPDPCE